GSYCFSAGSDGSVFMSSINALGESTAKEPLEERLILMDRYGLECARAEARDQLQLLTQQTQSEIMCHQREGLNSDRKLKAATQKTLQIEDDLASEIQQIKQQLEENTAAHKAAMAASEKAQERALSSMEAYYEKKLATYSEAYIKLQMEHDRLLEAYEKKKVDDEERAAS
ncbi:unnamed protein product, partial [Chrysoparadoxa australica]